MKDGKEVIARFREKLQMKSLVLSEAVKNKHTHD